MTTFRGEFVRLWQDLPVPGQRLVLVHGSVVNGAVTWVAQEPLAELFELVVPDRRGFPPGPEVTEIDFEDEAVWLEPILEPAAHLVGHSYGGVIALFAAARRPELVRSLTVVEPPCLGVARGNPVVDAYEEASERLWSGPRDPEAFLRAFLEAVGAPVPPGRFSPALLQGARMLMLERHPWEAEIPLDALAAAPFPTLVVSGAHSEPFVIVCDVLAARLGAERAVLPGAGHSVQRLGEPFNALLTSFVERADHANR
jgi:pimeloyl-ACP methyl ester carboxylesterase